MGRRQAATFQALAGIAGHGSAPPQPRVVRPKESKAKTPKRDDPTRPTAVNVEVPKSINSRKDIGLTVRIEVNLPAAADQQTYDRIFRSIRENLLNAE